MEYPDTKMQYHRMGHDSFTGVKKIYTSPNYYLFNIDAGKWKDLSLVRYLDQKNT